MLPDVNAVNSRGWTALMFAARNGHKEAVRALLAHRFVCIHLSIPSLPVCNFSLCGNIDRLYVQLLFYIGVLAMTWLLYC